MTQMPEAPGAQPGQVVDPYRSYAFELRDHGRMQAAFTRVENLGVTVGRALFRPAGEHSVVRSVPLQVTYTPVDLVYGVTSSLDLMHWLFSAVKGTVERRDITLAMLNAAGTEDVRCYNLIRAWICGWRATEFNTGDGGLAFERITLSYDRLELDDVTRGSA